MTRHIALGNGNMLVALDKDYCIRDFFYPYVGQENHVSGNHHRIGVWVDGQFSWLNRDEWKLDIKYAEDTLVSDVSGYCDRLKVGIHISEAVHFKKNVLLRTVKVNNDVDNEREIRVFFSQHFHINEANIGDTVYYNPELESIIDYKGKRYFLIGGQCNGKNFSDYATGVSGGLQNREGTWVDAEDGILSKNNVEHGSVDSTIGFSLKLKGRGECAIDYWIAVGKRYSEVKKLRDFVLESGVDSLINDTAEYAKNWVLKAEVDFCNLSPEIVRLFKRSLLVLRTQVDNRGAIIAANDTHTLRMKKDTYSYMWPRDGALVARALDRTGHHGMTSRFFTFCANAVSENGYLLHKYRPDGSLGSSWHSWMKGEVMQLPIQEDETALVLDALWKHYSKTGDEKLIKGMYKDFIRKAGDFLVEFRDAKTGLPKESYDLWEEKLGIHTFTCSTVYAGLRAAEQFAAKFGNKTNVKKYAKAASEVREAIVKYLFDEEGGVFVKGIYLDDDSMPQLDKTVDSSTVYGLFEFNVLEADDPRLAKTMDVTLERLWNNVGCGGLCRYENDWYYRKVSGLSNPWFVCTMWLCEYYIKRANGVEELGKAVELFDWVVSKALPSGVLSEQINPVSCEALSVSPLTWSHAGFITAVVKYLDRYEEFMK